MSFTLNSCVTRMQEMFLFSYTHVFYSFFSVERHQLDIVKSRLAAILSHPWMMESRHAFIKDCLYCYWAQKRHLLRAVKFSFGKTSDVVFVDNFAIFCQIPNLFSIRRVYCCNSWNCLVYNAANYPVWHQTFPTCNYPGTVKKRSDKKRSLFLRGCCFHSDINGTLE